MRDTRRQILDVIHRESKRGAELADHLGISETAVSEHIEALGARGFEFETGDSGIELVAVPEYGGAAVELGLDAPYRIEYHETAASTNDVARALADRGETDVVVLADEQTGGRGRRDRAWQSPPGGIWLSVLIRPDIPPASVSLVTLGAAVAVVEAVETAGLDATIKWPNDVLVETEGGETAKLAGILTEMAGESAEVSWVVVGIGINANVDDTVLAQGATSIRALVGETNRREIVQELLESFHRLTKDPAAILPRWIEHASTPGQDVRVDTGSGTVTGQAVEVTDVGALVIQTAEGTQTVHAGDCEHLRPVEDGS